MKTLCVTGHRPAKLPWKYKKEGLEYDEYCESLSCYIDDCIRHGYTHFISGMALGVDMDFAETVLDFKAQYGFPILLECARYPTAWGSWPSFPISPSPQTNV